ncbi:MAG: secretin N-terminal domain-containing protein [Candidatus Omnitrophota bacterium]
MKTKWVKMRAVFLLLGVGIFLAVYGQTFQPVLQAQQEQAVTESEEPIALLPPAAEQAQEPLSAESAQALEEASTTKPENITVDFKDADIHDVLKIIAYKSGINIVAGKDVIGTVTIRLVDVPWERALEVILKNAGFVYERDQDIIRVTTIDNLSKEELSTEIFILNYADAEQISESIKSMLTSRGSIKFDERTNQVVVTDVPTNLYKIGKVVEKLDQRTHQVVIEAKVIETTLADDENLGINWTAQVSANGATRPLMFPWAYYKSYGKTGLEYFPQVDTTADEFAASQSNGFPYAPYANQTEGGDFRFGTLSFENLQMILNLLRTRSDTKTLSNPSIVTLNNKEAVIHVGEDFGVPTYERNTSTGTMEITGYTTRKVGVKLTVTPHVNAEKEIVIDMHPEVSAFVRNQIFGDIEVPVFSVREATTQIMVKDGDTIVIGELISDTNIDAVRKIPILGDIPLIGHIFRSTTKGVDKTDLIIFITVRLIDTEGKKIAQQQTKAEEK